MIDFYMYYIRQRYGIKCSASDSSGISWWFIKE